MSTIALRKLSGILSLSEKNISNYNTLQTEIRDEKIKMIIIIVRVKKKKNIITINL